MSFFTQDFAKRITPDTKESLIKHLLNADDYETKTEIPIRREAVLMSVFDLLNAIYSHPDDRAVLLAREGIKPIDHEPRVGDMMGYLGKRMRINMMPWLRQSRKEATAALQSGEIQHVRESRLQRLMGVST